MLVAGAGTDKANATKIVSDLRNLKSAALMYYADNNKWPAVGPAGDTLAGYMDRAISTDYRIENNTSGDWVGYQNGFIATGDGGVNKKLAGMAKESGLYDENGVEYTSTKTSIWMKVR